MLLFALCYCSHYACAHGQASDALKDKTSLWIPTGAANEIKAVVAPLGSSTGKKVKVWPSLALTLTLSRAAC